MCTKDNMDGVKMRNAKAIQYYKMIVSKYIPVSSLCVCV